MKTLKFATKAVTGYDAEVEGKNIKIEPTFSGHIELKIPNFFERQELKSLLVGVVAKDGEADLEALQKGKMSGKVNVGAVVRGMADLVKASVPFYQAVALKHLASGKEYASFEDLSYEPAAEGILQEVAQELASGLAPSKN